jgi:farnesyl-diphosphate farnesyltransferase
MPDLDLLLEKTSRTFALSIPLLPEPTRREVTVAYLLFRIADTFEDSSSWPRENRMEALEGFCGLLERADAAKDEELAEYWVAEAKRLAGYWAEEMPLTHEGYRELMRDSPYVLHEYAALTLDARRLVREHTVRTALGMSGFVGEMLTELFLLERTPLESVGPYLRERSRAFGEGLQLVNILKDSAADVREGRAYIPAGVDRSAVFDLARADLEAATEYTLALQQAGAESGLVAFNALPVRLAWATLDRVEREGPGAKISREEVWDIVASLERALEADDPAVEPPVSQPAG